MIEDTEQVRLLKQQLRYLEMDNELLRKQAFASTELMLSGEALRESLMVKAILGDAFTPKS